MFYERQDILKLVFCLSKATYINFSFRKKSIFWHVLRKYNPLSSLIMRKVSCNIQKYYILPFIKHFHSYDDSIFENLSIIFHSTVICHTPDIKTLNVDYKIRRNSPSYDNFSDI
jgi:hypothetical protein